MSDVVNLRQARKARKRAEDAVTAAANRAKFGQGKAVKRQQQDDAARQTRLLDGAKRERD
jgi:hypothetical protein